MLGRPPNVPRRAGQQSHIELEDIQGNVLRGYNFSCARYLVARVRDDREAPAAARSWLAAQAGPVTTDADWTVRPRLVGNLALSHAGLAALGLRDEIAAFAERTQGLDPTALRTAWRDWRAA